MSTKRIPWAFLICSSSFPLSGCSDDAASDAVAAADEAGVLTVDEGSNDELDASALPLTERDSSESTSPDAAASSADSSRRDTTSVEAPTDAASQADAGTQDGSTEDASGPPDLDCDRTIVIEAGQNYGEYTVFAVRVDLELAPGEYAIRVNDGTAYVFKGDALGGTFAYDVSASLADGASQTVSFPGFFDIDLRSQTQPDLTGLGESIFDGCHLIEVEDSTSIVAGQVYGDFLVEALTVDPAAASGSYTFFAASGNTGSVELRLDGMAVDSLDYNWQTTIGGGDSYTFEFPAVLTLTVTRAAGTSNLFGLAASVFDGRHRAVVP